MAILRTQFNINNQKERKEEKKKKALLISEDIWKQADVELTIFPCQSHMLLSSAFIQTQTCAYMDPTFYLFTHFHYRQKKKHSHNENEFQISL